MPPLKQPWKKRRAQEAERRATKELEKEMKETRDKEKEVHVYTPPHIMNIIVVLVHSLCRR